MSGMSPGNLVMDLYEPARMRRALSRLGIEVRVSALSHGDYLLSDSVCIERKTVQDFMSSMYSGRLGYQLNSLVRSFDSPVILIEGRPEDNARRINLKSFYGYITKLLVSGSVGLIQTPDMSTSALVISLISLKTGPVTIRPKCRTARKPRDEDEAALGVLSSFPSIGPVLASRALSHMGNLKNVLQADEEEIAEIHGFGKVRARTLAKVLGRRFKGGTREAVTSESG
jgi:ERCC4-type nuclease